MRIAIAGIFLLSGVACMAQAPQMQQQHSYAPAQDGGVREVLESIVIPPIPHSPFTATLATEWTRYTPDGASITLVNERRIARDGRGRVYQERWYLVPKDGKVQSTMNWIQIADPKALIRYNCSVEKHRCDLLPYDPGDALAAVSAHRTSGQMPEGRGEIAIEELGERNMAGVDTVGIRETDTINPGVMGNDRPITAVSESWHSKELAINVLSIVTGPTIGKQTFTITELTPSEPDPQLFELPAGYKVNDQRKDPAVSR